MYNALRTVLDQALPFQLAVAVPNAIAVAAVTAEVIWRARSDRRILCAARTGSAMVAGAFVVGIGYTAVLRVLWQALAEFRLEPAAALWRDHPIAAGIAAFIAWDAVGWLYPRHRSPHPGRLGGPQSAPFRRELRHHARAPPDDGPPVIVRASGSTPTSAIGIELAGWRDLLSRRVA